MKEKKRDDYSGYSRYYNNIGKGSEKHYQNNRCVLSLFAQDVIIYLDKPGKSVNIITSNNSKVVIYNLKSRTFIYISCIL